MVQPGLLGDLAQGEASGMSIGEGFAPRLPHSLGISLKSRLSVADRFAGSIVLGVGWHDQSLFIPREGDR